ncbi:aminoglycoside phosphotransferase family protein [Streptosporangium lutulentum]|uniref:Thiamine kinase-like enzyme n=1 Tax=Streptosporangium lutulentum TaxID=1461250 RepID=A0ABT9Q6J0_9ACTN|nr:phosphotransferase [Streptosporangium lutulentum]MDP9842353.1 thiamine kinase-like enzyme [Streptosporangium lutulentum]
MIKRFRSWERGEPEAEWRALTLLAKYAPGLAPHPLHAELTAYPAITMSRLPGTPLRGQTLTSQQLAMLAEAITTLHAAVPARVLEDLAPRRGHPAQIIDLLRSWCAELSLHDADPEVTQAFQAGKAWLDLTGEEIAENPGTPVFGIGDGNLANCLWDGSRIRLVDFEESGRSDRAFELAEVTEHVSAWVDTDLDVLALLGHFALTPAETRRLRDCRRLLALTWLIMLMHDDPVHPRNPSGTVERQAARLLTRLG